MARKTPDTGMQEMFEAFTRFMQAQSVPATEVVPESRKSATGASKARKTTRSSGPKVTTANRTAKTTSTPSRKTAKGVITCQQAWQALGADPTYQPSDPNAPARNGQLWALNAAGKLRLA